MVMDDQEPTNQENLGSGRGLTHSTVGFRLAAFALAAITIAVGIGILMVRNRFLADAASAADTKTAEPESQRPKMVLFKDWPKPDLVLVLSAQMHGHDQPCGCTFPQMGGLVRRYNFIQSLKNRGWKVVAVDLGDIAQHEGPQKLPNIQGLIKYKYAMLSLKAMDYSAVGLGETDAALPLFNALGEYALNYPRPRILAANLLNKDNDFPGEAKDYLDHQPSVIGNWQIEPKDPNTKDLKVGIVGIVGKLTAEQIQARDRTLKFADNNTNLPTVLKDLDTRGKPDLRVLLYQGSLARNQVAGMEPEAVVCAQKFPQFQVVLALSEEDEPPSDAKKVGNSYVIGVGHKGKYVGAVGVYRTGNPQKPFDLRYQLVPMSEEFNTAAKDIKDHPVMKLMEDYTKELRDNKYLEKFVLGQHPIQVAYPGAAYVGSAACQKCHAAEHATWASSPHSKAFKALVKSENPSLRQFDAECVVCHSVGFGYNTGFKGKGTDLINVGCESCHGPGSLHVANSKNVAMAEALSPWRRQPGETDDKKRIARIDQFCQKCHDIENDVHWKKFKDKWENGIDHLSKHPIEWPKEEKK